MRPNCRRLLTRAGVALVALLALPVESAAATAVQKCAAAKLRAAGREIAAKMGCYANAKKAAAGVDSTCLGKAQGRADMAISKAQGGCRGTAAAIDAAVDTCVAALLGDDPGNGLCPSASAKVLGTSASREVRCEAADVRAQESFTECNAIENSRTTTALSALGGCVASGPALADSDACRSAIGDLIGPCGTFLTAWSTSFGDPEGVAVDGSGNVFVADAGNFFAGAGNTRIDKFDNAGVFLTSWSTLGSGPGQFHLPLGVAVDGSGNVFIADASSDGSGTNRIQKFDVNGVFLTAWGSLGSGNGQLFLPSGVATDGSGSVYVADTYNHRIQKFACP